MEKKSNKGLIITIVILTILLLGTIGYVCYDKLYLNNENKPAKEEPKTEEKLSEETIKELHESLILKQLNISGTEFYSKEKRTNDKYGSILLEEALKRYVYEKNIEVDPKYAFNAKKGYYYTYDDNGYEKPIDETKIKNQVIAKKEIDSYAKELYNVDSIELMDGDVLDAGELAYYNKNNDSFYLYRSPKGGESYTVESKFIESKQENDIIYIYDKAVICSAGEGGFACQKTIDDPEVLFNGTERVDDSSSKNIYYDKNGKEINPNKGYYENFTWNFEAIFEDFDKELNTFKHTFKKAENGNYYWYSSEVVK